MAEQKSKRRDKGDGSVYQRKDKTWAAQLRFGKKADGKPNEKTFYGKTEREVKKKLKDFKHDLIKNDYAEVQKNTVKDYMDNWLYNIKVNDLKPKTFDVKELTLQNQVYPYIGDMQIGNVTANDIQSMVNQLVEKGYAYDTIKKAYDSVNSCFKLGIAKDEIVKNPCLGIILPKKKKRNMSNIQFFTDGQVRLICEECVKTYGTGSPVYRLGQAIILLLYTGIRIGECLALKWEDIDFEKRTLSIHANIVVIKNRDKHAKAKYIPIYQETPKSEAGIRTVELNKKAINALTELKKINGKFEYVVCSGNGKILYPANIDRMFRVILKCCKIDGCGVHTCRHTFASMLFRKGVDVKTVSELLGHSDVSVTYDTYIHLIKEQKRQAIELLDEL